MAHFAKVFNGIVTDVIVAEPDFFETFVDSSPGDWIQTSYNTRGGIHYNPATGLPSTDQTKALRKNFAGIGYSYDPALDAFIPPKPFSSWILDLETALWNPPTPMPIPENDSVSYVWNEGALSWDEVVNVPIGEMDDAGNI